MYRTLEEAEQNKTGDKLWFIAGIDNVLYLLWR
jgi:hypothetical protein